ncbi:MAG: CDP-2,3-bis-(O-geranylgeranyl)-sn-glycerol synthase [Thermoprotei archaeon]|nr:MAG: CDP-2,3-bis-(O-geranylgeranyl)-sn-glycerol synthase [Thermoprotei archaeon]RLF24609.1 MAG: CDP-2,3-bis-(O-geranylgeranyl)-sn-glycerol synthase [Thermoprotei archaeon]
MESLSSLVLLVLRAIWYILPAYAANGAPVVLSKFIKGRPIDRGKLFIDGKRILGDGKTVEGFLVGILVGILVGVIQRSPFGDKGALMRSIPLSFGAMLGDLIGSFIKRRLGIPRGAPAPLLDQLDFLLFALLLSHLSGFSLGADLVLVLLLLTPILHILTNRLAYLMKLKSVPW